jgi:putative alpha-1,2-mannosidase
MQNNFGTGADGLPGNDDCGTISAWFAFSALGLYPFCPTSNSYRAGEPLFDEIKIQLSEKYYSGNQLIINRKSTVTKKILLNNNEITDYSINHYDLVKGGELIFK